MLSGSETMQKGVPSEASASKAEAAVKAFKLQTLADLQVVLAAMVLSECVYKLVDMGEAESAQAATFFVNQFPPGFAKLLHMQGAALAAHHRYMLGADDTSLYVVFMGTKHMRDLVADANLLQEAVWQDEKQQSDALAHRGFLARSRRIPIEALYAHARGQGKRLVLCGHSLGGAVALLCTLRLLRWLDQISPPLQCICFGTPAIGDAALAALVHQHGWEEHILNFILPEDIIPRMLALPTAVAASLPDASAAAQQTSCSSSSLSQEVPSLAQQRLQKLKAMLMNRKAELQPADNARHGSEQLSQQHPEQDPVQPSVNTQQARPAGLLSNVQQLQARLRTRMQSPQQSSGNADPDANLNGLPGTQQPTLRSADPGLDSSTEPGLGKPATRLQGFVRMPWRRDSSARSAMPQAPVTEHTGRTTDAVADADIPASAAAAPPVADKGVALDAAVPQPVSLLRSFSQKLPSLSWKAFPTFEPATKLSHPSSPQSNTDKPVYTPEKLDELSSDADTSQQTHGQQPSAWQRIGSQLQQAVQGAGSRVKAVASFLPSYTAYVHIGSHQILLPAAPALTQAVQSAQQQGSAEQQQQALLMHSMAAYRGRALAICRSALHWDTSSTALEVTLSADLAPPLVLSQLVLTVPPLPYHALAAAAKPSWQPQQPKQSIKPPAQAAGQVMPSQPSSAPFSRSRLLPWGIRQQQQPFAHQGPEAVRYGQSAHGDNQAAPVSEGQPVRSDQQSSELLPPSDSIQQPLPAGRQQNLEGKQKQPVKNGPDRLTASHTGQRTFNEPTMTPTIEQPGRWFSPAGVLWPAQSKVKEAAKVCIQIKAHGSSHGMPVKGQLQILGQAWHKARLISPNSKAPSKPVGDADVIEAAAAQISTMADRLWRLLPWQAAEQPAPNLAKDVMLFEAEVPNSLLQMLVDRLEQQNTAQVTGLGASVRQHTEQSRLQEPELVKLKLQTDFVVQEFDVQARLPVVWLLGPDTVSCEAVWQRLTQPDAPDVRATQASPDGATLEQLEESAASFSQRLQQRLSKLTGKDVLSQVAAMQLPSARQAGIDYVLVRHSTLPFVDLLSVVGLVLRQMARPDTKQKLSTAGLSGRMRAVYHRRGLQSLQTELHQGGLPDAFVFVLRGATDDCASAGLADLSSQVSALQVALLGVSVGMQHNANNLKQFGPEQWVVLPEDLQSGSSAEASQLRQRLHALMYSRMVGQRSSKL